MQFTKGQQHAFDVVTKSNESLLITGPGGTGKTLVINEIIKQLKKNGRVPKTAAYTGLAAQHIQGTTLSRLLGVGLARNYNTVPNYYQALQTIKKTLEGVTDLFIDEISMVSGDFLRMADLLIRDALEGPDIPFGGIRVVYSGDFLQLPPINGRNDPELEYKWAFQYPIFKNVQVVQLTKSMRQESIKDVRILNELRLGIMSPEGARFLAEAQNRVIEEPVELHSHNKLVDEINTRELKALAGKIYHYDTGFNPGKQMKKMLTNVPIGDTVSLKKGAPVIVLVNKPDGGYYNGTQGKVLACKKNGVEIKVPGYGKRLITLHTWKVDLGYKEHPGSVIGMPLKLGWAATIHRCQGMSLDRIRTDLRDCWEPGHAYVALSRARSLDNVQVVRPPKQFHTDPDALAYVQSLPHIEETV